MISHGEYLEMLGASIGPAILGAVASLIRLGRYGWKGFQHFLAGMLTSVFTAILTGLLLDMSDLPPTAITALVGMAAYSGGTLLDAVLWRADKEIRTARIPGIRSRQAEEAEADE